MSEVDLRVPEKELAIRPMTDEAYAEWCEAIRERPHPIPPNNPEAPDHTIFRQMIWENRQIKNERSGDIQAGIWYRNSIVGLINLYYKSAQNKGQLGYEVAPRYRRRGFASAAVEALTDYALDDMHLDLVEILILPSNIASPGVALKAGFKKVGKEALWWAFNKSRAQSVEEGAYLKEDLAAHGMGQSGLDLDVLEVSE